MADEPEIITDAAGQEGGEHPEVAARVAEEQRQLIAKIRAERAPLDEEENRHRDEARDAELRARAERRELSAMVKDLKERVEALEAQNR